MHTADRLILRFALAAFAAAPLANQVSYAQTPPVVAPAKKEQTGINAADALLARKYLGEYYAAEKGPGPAARLATGAVVLHRIGAHSEAVAAADKAATLFAADAEADASDHRSVVASYYQIGEFDKALTYATAHSIEDGSTLIAVGAAQAEAKNAGAKATLLKAQAKAGEITELGDRVEMLHQIAEGFLKAGMKSDAQAVLALARTSLEQDKTRAGGIARFEGRVTNATLMYRAGQTAEARAEAAKIEKEVLASSYVPNEQAIPLYRLATLAREMGDVPKADALVAKAGVLFQKIGSTEDRVAMVEEALIQQALAGQADQAIARAKKGEGETVPLRVFQMIGDSLSKSGRTADAKNAFTSALGELSILENPRTQLNVTLTIAKDLSKAGDKAGALALFRDVETKIPAKAEGFMLGVMWATWVQAVAPTDLTLAATHIADVPEQFHVTVYRDLAEAAAGIKK